MQTAQLLPPPAPTEGLADVDIAAAVETLLVTKKGLAEQLIAVQTHHSTVALAGFTTNLLARQRAEEIARAVRGVRGPRGKQPPARAEHPPVQQP